MGSINPDRWVSEATCFISSGKRPCTFWSLCVSVSISCLLFQSKHSGVLWKIDKTGYIDLACSAFFYTRLLRTLGPTAHLFSLWKHYMMAMSINPYLLYPEKLEWVIFALLTTLQMLKGMFWMTWHSLRTFEAFKRMVVWRWVKEHVPFQTLRLPVPFAVKGSLYHKRMGLLFKSYLSPESQHSETAESQGWNPRETLAQNAVIQTETVLMTIWPAGVALGDGSCYSFILGFRDCRTCDLFLVFYPLSFFPDSLTNCHFGKTLASDESFVVWK